MADTDEESIEEMETDVPEDVEVEEEEESVETEISPKRSKRLSPTKSKSPSPNKNKLPIARITRKKTPVREIASKDSQDVQSKAQPKSDLMSYVMIEVPADGKEGSEKSIYLVPKIAVKPSHTLLTSAGAFAVRDTALSGENFVTPEKLPQRKDTDTVKIQSLAYFTANKKSLKLPPSWSLMVFPKFVAFVQQTANADLSQSLTSWFSKCICLDADLQPSLKIHDVPVSTTFLRTLDQPFGPTGLYNLLESLSHTAFCPGLGLEDAVVDAAVEGVVVPFKSPDCVVLVDQRRNCPRCSSCVQVRANFLRKLKKK